MNLLAVAIAMALMAGSAVAKDLCAICGGRFERVAYFLTDKVAGERKEICEQCAHNSAICYQCGLPTQDDRTTLADGRILCARDARSVILDESAALEICQEVKEGLDRHFARFTTFPETNVTVSIVDRVHLMSLFKVPGNDYACPNILGYTSQETNEMGRGFHISLMSGLMKPVLRATCAHEFTHAWISENVSPARQKRLRPDAREGFCELVSYLLMNLQGDREAAALIRSNGYTRGHIDLFIEAESRFGFNEIVDWMKHGEDDSLNSSDLGRVRAVVSSRRPDQVSKPLAVVPVAPPQTFDQLTVQGITWSKTRPMAMINGRTFEPRDEAKVRLGNTNVTLRCLAITQDSVVIQVAGAAELETLKFKAR